MITRLNISRSKSLGQEYLSSKVNKCVLLGPVPQDSPITSLAKDCDDGLKRFVEPVKALDCLSGTYFLRDRNKRFKLVFKPCDEENITRGGFSEGGGMLRELIAFLLDKSFANVPHTQLAEVVYRPFCASDSPSLPVCKRGSVQQYVRAECSADDMGACRFEAEDVHRIAVMDIRLCNLDRHAGNILCVRENGGPSSLSVDWGGVSLSVDSGGQSLASSAPASFSFEALLLLADEDSSPPRVSPKEEVARLRLVPIDHGYTLPHLLFLGDAHFAWLHWPQASLPLSEETMRYVESIDVEADIRAIEAAVGAGEVGPVGMPSFFSL